MSGLIVVLSLASVVAPGFQAPDASHRPRAREAGVVVGRMAPGERNAITDVAGVRVGHCTLVEGEDVRTGVTVVLPHGGNPYRRKVPAAVVVGNGYGKLVGVTQVRELGELESPIALTNTLCVGRVMDGVVGWLLEQPGNEGVRSVNAVVGETNDGFLNDIRERHVGAEHVRVALAEALGEGGTGEVREGCVGAGMGTRCLGFKGGIGTASRVVGEWTVGVLVQSNFGGRLTVAGEAVGDALRAERDGDGRERGSCMIVVATDAPLDARNLERLGWRGLAGMARTGASFSNGSGDYVLAFSTVRAGGEEVLENARMSPLFVAVAEATEEAILNSMFKAVSVTGNERTVEALPVERVVELVK